MYIYILLKGIYMREENCPSFSILLRSIDVSKIYNEKRELQCGTLVMEVWHGKRGQREASHTCRLSVDKYYDN